MTDAAQPQQPNTPTTSATPAENTPAAPSTSTPPSTEKTFSSVPPGTPPTTPPTPEANSTAPDSSSPKPRWYHISKGTLILIVVLGGLASFLFYLALGPKSTKPKETAVAPTPTPYAQSLLTLEKAPVGTQEAQLAKKTQTYNVVLTTNADMVNAVQLELGFDPQVINVTDVSSGPFVTNPVQLTKDINNKTGRISYAVGVGPNDKPIQGTGVVATITFSFVPLATASSTTISFLPKTLVAGSGVNPSVLKSTTDATISVESAPTTPATIKTSPLPTQ